MAANQELLLACQAGSKSQVLSLIKQGCDAATRDDKGVSAIHYACLSDNAAMVSFILLHNPWAISARDVDGDTPLHYAFRAGSLPVVMVLVGLGADLGCLNSRGYRPIELCTNQSVLSWVRGRDVPRGVGSNGTSRLGTHAAEPDLGRSPRLNPKAQESDYF